jgi:SAM-dependent methyltransferase
MAVSHKSRELYDRALRKARVAAFPPAEFVGQESFMQASEIEWLAARAGIASESTVLDLCCGVGGPGVLIAKRFGCRYHGVDASAAAVRIARNRASGLSCQFDVAAVPPLPTGPYDVVLLLETFLAFPDKVELIRQVATALRPGGRFAFTVEEGPPLTPSERLAMPESDTVWLVPLSELQLMLAATGLTVTWQHDCSRSHQLTAQRLYDELSVNATDIGRQIGAEVVDSLLRSHRLWSQWLRTGRVRKFAVIAER